ncbi:MAG: hypothetical protein Pg6C_10360 [Treponemataceae bacterium]|nr:MAG: hypothetical protein Pg6C_10360 [Treponemataceae bacterium]
MVKKTLLLLVLAALVAGGVFAQEGPVKFSAGGGFDMNMSSVTSKKTKDEIQHSLMLYGFYGAFDVGLTAIPLSFELDVGMGFGEYSIKVGDVGLDPLKSFIGLDLGFYAKYTFIDKEKWMLFAGAGIGYPLILKADDYEKPMDFSQMNIVGLFGGGYKFNEHLSLIGRLDGGIGFQSKFLKDADIGDAIEATPFGIAFKVGVMYAF